ncbi:DUF3578 domain-containing protein [Haemophilus haemoglobinophilus]|nr:DUF3578 domain-containing protein [Canicola haemoglobinophilus]MBN6711810.1 DUF3578 domain-containing protein [Canicola haemoglobinophilus]
MELKEIFTHILVEWENAQKTEPFNRNNSMFKFFSEIFKEKFKDIISNEYTVKASVGEGGWAIIPHLTIHSNDISSGAKSGVYPAYLFCADMSGFYLSLQQGSDFLLKQFKPKKVFIDEVNRRRNYLLERHPRLSSWGKVDMNLKHSGKRAKTYENVNISAKFYDFNNVPLSDRLEKDLFELLDIYNEMKDDIISITKLENSDKIEDHKIIEMINKDGAFIHLPKPFLLLAGVSGTGKSRFVREQVAEFDRKERYQLVAVRPDWHEPSDLLGYVSRLSGTAQYVMTDVLKFIVKAWQAVEKAGFIANNKVTGNRAQLPQVLPYWLCLDEMNLAPVEQYFADYLSALETREWKWDKDNFSYHSEPLLSPTAWADIADFQQQLGVSDVLWAFFQQNGIGIPFNLIVAGTVNMDETTHAFSRKVLDRALSFDFSEFYPNDFQAFFEPTAKPKLLSYPIYSQLKQGDLDDELADKSIKFLTALNQQFEHTPFKLGFRALNELLLSVHSFNPQTDEELQAVWDDFVMTKILPRIEGDEAKVGDVLDKIEEKLKDQLKNIWGVNKCPDLWRENMDEQTSSLEIPCRSKVKLEQMKKLLTERGMVSFW